MHPMRHARDYGRDGTSARKSSFSSSRMIVMERRGKILALSTGVVGFAVMGVAGLGAKGWIAEQYYICWLRSSREETRLKAVEVLADVQSIRAVPHLIELLQKEPREKVSLWAWASASSSGTGSSSRPDLPPRTPSGRHWSSESSRPEM